MKSMFKEVNKIYDYHKRDNDFFSSGRRISSFGYLMTSLKMASGLDKQESIFTASLRP